MSVSLNQVDTVGDCIPPDERVDETKSVPQRKIPDLRPGMKFFAKKIQNLDLLELKRPPPRFMIVQTYPRL